MAGPQCGENPPQELGNPSPSMSLDLKGRVETLGHLTAYVSYGSRDIQKAVILVSDVYGYEALNLRRLADKVASCGYFVLVPDYFHGDPYVCACTGDPFANQPEWLQKHQPAKGLEDSKKLIEILNNKGITSIGASGFCWGAKVVVELAKGDYIKAGVLLHPSLLLEDDFRVIKAPIAILGAEFDHITPPEFIEKYEAILSARPEVDSFVKIYPAVAHGWAVRYNNDNEVAMKNAELAHGKMLEWFSTYLK
jgi:dienelactone hydrolase|uniref:Dienelactone hydrolase domain-containing protein n=1 Tax=Picea sitchensis TaxID=3332 RepID=A9NTV6_PICSI|nr:unknown [Picea sitchensis]